MGWFGVGVTLIAIWGYGPLALDLWWNRKNYIQELAEKWISGNGWQDACWSQYPGWGKTPTLMRTRVRVGMLGLTSKGYSYWGVRVIRKWKLRWLDRQIKKVEHDINSDLQKRLNDLAYVRDQLKAGKKWKTLRKFLGGDASRRS